MKSKKYTKSLYSELFSNDRILHLFADEKHLDYILKVEIALSEAQKTLGIIPERAYLNIKKSIKNFKTKPKLLKKHIANSGVIIPGVLQIIEESMEDKYVQYLHMGATSQDIIDTALILQLRDSLVVIERQLDELLKKLSALTKKNQETIMFGRTRGKKSSVITLSYKTATWLSAFIRHKKRIQEIKLRGLFSLQLGGASGNLASLGDRGIEVQRILGKKLDLNIPSIPWHTQRDCLVEFGNWLSLVSSSLGKIGSDLLFLSQSETQEISFKNSGTSSAMPHKSNPVLPEIIIAIARINANNVSTMHQSIIHMNERSGDSWVMEWDTLPRMVELSSAALKHACNSLKDMTINKDRMYINIDTTYGIGLSEIFYSLLLKKYSKKDSLRIIKNSINKSKRNKVHLADVLSNDLDVSISWSKYKNYKYQLGSSSKFVDQVLKEYTKLTVK